MNKSYIENIAKNVTTIRMKKKKVIIYYYTVNINKNYNSIL